MAAVVIPPAPDAKTKSITSQESLLLGGGGAVVGATVAAVVGHKKVSPWIGALLGAVTGVGVAFFTDFAEAK